MLRRLIFSAGFLLVAATTDADTTLVYDQGERQSLLRIAGDRIRFDNAGDGRWFLFDAVRREVTLVDPARREYAVIDEATLEQLQATMDAVLTPLQDRLAQMPAAMREQFQQLTGGVLPDPAAGAAVRLEATGRRGEAAGYGCEYTRVKIEGEIRSEVCLASSSSLGIVAPDRAVVREWQGFAGTMAGVARRYVSVDAALLGEDGQIPIIYRSSGAGDAGTLREVSPAPIDSDVMRVPEGFSETGLELPLP